MTATDFTDGGGIHDVPRPGRPIKIMTFDEMLARPIPTWLVQDLVQRGSLCVFWGLPATCKTFVVASIALAVATGEAWFGHRAEPGVVVFVAAEGGAGLPLRVRVWAGREMPALEGRLRSNFFTVGESVSFLLCEEESLLAALAARGLRPVLVVIDTLSRCLPGGDENSARDMSRFVEACDRIRIETGATVAVVHHADKSGSDARGSSVLRGAADSMFTVKRDEKGIVHLIADKQKDALKHAPMKFTLEVVPLDEGTDAATSCRLVRHGDGDSEWQSLRPATRQVCDCLRKWSDPRGATADELSRATKLDVKTVYNSAKQASTAGYIKEVGRTDPRRFVVTDKLKDLKSPKSSSFSGTNSSTAPEGSPSSSPFMGETESREPDTKGKADASEGVNS